MKNGELVVKYFPMAMRIADKFRCDDRTDNRGAALDGLIAAAQKYDGRRPFMAFAAKRIAGEIRDTWIRERVGKGKRRHLLRIETSGSYQMQGLGFDLLDADLTAKESAVIRMVFWMDTTQHEAGKAVNVCESRAHQLKDQAFRKIKARLAARGITRLAQIL